MSRLDLEALMTIKTLKNRTAKTEIARLLQVTESAVRYHMGRMEAGAVDGRSRQMFKAEAFTEAIEFWRSQHVGPLDLGDLHDWLRREHASHLHRATFPQRHRAAGEAVRPLHQVDRSQGCLAVLVGLKRASACSANLT